MTTLAAQTERVACPYCASTIANPVRQSADIVECLECGTVYLRTRLRPEVLYALYQNYAHEGSHMRLPKTRQEIEQSGLRREEFVRLVLEFIEPGGIWLDIGCGWGAMLDHVRSLGFTPRGIELTRDCVDFAAMVLGIPVSNTDFVQSHIEPASCTVISMVHTLEHLTNPAEALRKVHATLTDNGIFCGIVPNFDSLCSELLLEGWAWLDPQYHYVHYTPTTLEKHLRSAGFAIRHLSTATGDYGEDIVLNYLRSVMPSLPGQLSYRQLLRAVEEDGRGEEIRFVAQKV